MQTSFDSSSWKKDCQLPLELGATPKNRELSSLKVNSEVIILKIKQCLYYE